MQFTWQVACDKFSIKNPLRFQFEEVKTYPWKVLVKFPRIRNYRFVGPFYESHTLTQQLYNIRDSYCIISRLQIYMYETSRE